MWGSVLYSDAQIGEMPWVLTDFMTKQEIRRVVGNRYGKGQNVDIRHLK